MNDFFGVEHASVHADYFGLDDLLSQMEEDRIYAQVCNDYSSQWHELVSRLPAQSEGSEVQLGSSTGR